MLTNYVSKLGKYVWCFNLPRSTCEKYRTPICNKNCYAKRGRFCYKTTKDALQRNMEWSQSSNFAQNLCSQIEEAILETGVKRIRLHSSGEFYNVRYYNAWVKAAKEFPKILFLAYTRNTDIDFSKAPANFNIFFSVDESTQKINKSCKLTSTLDTHSTGIVKHMAPHKNGFVCNSHCHSCSHCWKTKHNIVFYNNMAARMACLKTLFKKTLATGQQSLFGEMYKKKMLELING